MSWFNTVEFYVIAATAAAAAVALAALPRKRTENILHMEAGALSHSGEGPMLKVWVDDDRRVHIRRTGLPDNDDTGAVSLAVNMAGFDVTIDERLVRGKGTGESVDTAEFVLDYFGRERYHICYRGDDTGVFTAFTLPVQEGVKITRDLRV